MRVHSRLCIILVFGSLLGCQLGLNSDPKPLRQSFENQKAQVQSPDASAMSTNYLKQIPSGAVDRILDRGQVRSVFEEIFGEDLVITPQAPEGARTAGEIYFSNMQGLWGKPCDTNAGKGGDSDCRGSTGNSKIPSLPQGFSSRASLKIQVCEEYSGRDSTLDHAIRYLMDDGDLDLGRLPAPDAASVGKVWEGFHGGEAIPPSVQTVINSFLTELSAQPAFASSRERWRALILLVCISPSWELL